MKIIATMSDAYGAANAGAQVENSSVILEIPDQTLPKSLRAFLERRGKARHQGGYFYEYLSLSILDEE